MPTRHVARVMADSVTVADLPRSATIVGAYVDGIYANAGAVHTRFPKAKIVTITVLGQTAAADVIDRETGDATASTAAAWYAAALKAGRQPTVYCSASAVHEVMTALARRRVPREKIQFWTAHYTGRPHLCGATCFAPYGLPWLPRVVATQYADPNTSGGHYDLSLLADHWAGVDRDVPPKPHHIPPHIGLGLHLLRRWLRKAHRKGWHLADPARTRLTALTGEVKAAEGTK